MWFYLELDPRWRGVHRVIGHAHHAKQDFATRSSSRLQSTTACHASVYKQAIATIMHTLKCTEWKRRTKLQISRGLLKVSV